MMMMMMMMIAGFRGPYDKTGMGTKAIAIILLLVLSSQTACARLILSDPFPRQLGGPEFEAWLDRRSGRLSATSAPTHNLTGNSAYYSIADYNTSVDEKRITTLPGFEGSTPSPHHTGYVHLIPKRSPESKPELNPSPSNDSSTSVPPNILSKSLFYYFVESERSPKTDPVVLWLNGGPGCSSMFGFSLINGPFRFEKASSNPFQHLPKLSVNPFAWSKVANMIYLDSPFGVGLSLGLLENDRSPNESPESDDWQTALDLHAFMLAWVEAHPAFSSNPIYLAGESYAGVYIPMLAMKIVEGMENHLQPALNLKGYLIGNGVAEAEQTLGFRSVGVVEASLGLSVITEEMYTWATTVCGSREVMIESWNAPVTCRHAAYVFDHLFLGYCTYRRLDIYNTLGPCDSDLQPRFKAYHDVVSAIARNMSSNLTDPADVIDPDNVMDLLLDCLASYPKSNQSRYCDDNDWLGAWFNNAQVRNAINVRPVSEIGNWTSCSELIRLRYETNGGNMVPIHRNLTSKYGLRVLIYSGDHDLVVPTSGSQAWLRYLGYGEAFPGSLMMERWKVGDRTAGFVQYFEKNLTFATVLGAGHAVPRDKPAEAFELFSSWIDKSGSFRY